VSISATTISGDLAPADTAPVAVPRWFVPAMAGFIGTAAIAIDSILPAFPEIRREYGLPPDSARPALLITFFMLGMAVGQLFYGPISDRFGRKRPMAIGFALYLAAGIGSVFAPNFTVLVAMRFLWGLGSAGPRSLTIAMVRDTSDGDRMAKAMSTIMAVFIAVPVFAPAAAAGLMRLGPWRSVLWMPIGLAAVLLVALHRMPESLPQERRRPIDPRSLLAAARTVVSNRSTVGYGLAMAFLFGVMSSYIGGIEVIVEDVYDRAEQFPLIFGAVAVFFAAGSLVNGRLVGRFGLPRVLRTGAVVAVAAAALHLAVVLAWRGRPPLLVELAALVVMLPVVMGTNPNCNTAAMAPMGHIAGMAAAVLGTASIATGALLGALSNAAFDGSVTPFAAFATVYVMLASASILLVGRPERPGRPGPR
jgi:DHA1 family bicyclomycin/chloramphenicol resistance-like MFS transporter